MNEVIDLRKPGYSPLDIARGSIAGSSPFGAFGRKTTSSAADTGLLWADGDWSIPDQVDGEQISIVSTSAEDSLTGTGIRTLHIHYLDNNLVDQDEVIELNGTTPVLTNATNIRFIQCAHLVTAGTTKASVGIITFKNLDGTKIYNQMDAETVRCSSSLRMVPSGKQAVIVGLVGSSVSGTAAASSQIGIAVSYFEGYDYTTQEILIPIASIGVQDTGMSYTLPIPHIAPEGTLIGMLCKTDKGAVMTGDWFGWLENAN